MESFKGWAVLELMGHRRLAGYVQEVTLAGAGMLRIDVPADEGDATQFFSPASVYALTPCTEATARIVAKGSAPAPVNEYEFPSLRGKALPAGPNYDDETDDETPRETLQRLVDEDGLDVVLRGLVELHTLHAVEGPHDEHDRQAGILARALELVKGAGPWIGSAGAGVRAIGDARLGQLAQYSAEHDDAVERDGQLLKAALQLVYEMCTNGFMDTPDWAYSYVTAHRADRPRVLANAGALIAAEIDRLKRAETKAPPIEAQAADLMGAHPEGVDIPATHAPAPTPIDINDEVHF